MINIESIRAFLEVSRTGNVSSAAKNMGVTQSALSQRIRSLEQDLGQSAFVRKYGGLELNSFGNEFLEVCKDVQHNIEVLDDWVSRQKNQVNGHLKIATISSMIGHVLPKFLKLFLKKYPAVKFTIDNSTSKYIEEGVMNGGYDVGMIVGECKKNSLKSLKIMENRVYMVCAKDYPLAQKKNFALADLKKARLIWHSEKTSRTVSQIWHKLGLHSINELGGIYLSDMESCKNYALQGLGVAFVADEHMRPELAQGKLIILGKFLTDKPIYMISRNDKYQSHLIKIFKEEFAQFCRQRKS
jgi:DNA-binding transcriptional LysR family regulator